MKLTEPDVLVIGAGPAGSIAAALLRRQGFKVGMVEKQTFPRFVLGESLLPSSLALLEEAGLLEAVTKKSFMRKTGAVFLRGEEVCNFSFANQFTDGFRHTYQVPRADFDQALADEVEAMGVEISYDHSVAGVEFNSTHAIATIEKSDGERFEVKSRFILDCSGHGRVLPRLLGLETPSNFPNREALFAHVTGDLRPAGEEEGKIWVCIHPLGAWLWIIPFSNGNTSVGVVASPEFFQQFSGEPETRLREILMGDPNAARRLEKMQFIFPPRSISGFACSVKKLFGERYALAGNATEFLDPIFSSGVALAFVSASRAAKVLTLQLRGETVDWQADYADFVMQGVNTFRSYVSAWYDGRLPQIFFAANRNPKIMGQICSVLAGHAWDQSNPYATQADRALSVLAKILGGNGQPVAR